MRLEKLFEVKERKLFKIADGSEVAVLPEMAVRVRWSDVEPEEGAYNESFLADLRNELKSLEARGAFVLVEPVCDKREDAEPLIAAMKHTARRIKDCAAVVGFAVPEELLGSADEYIAELGAKHAHYCFFCKKPLKSDVVLY